VKKSKPWWDSKCQATVDLRRKYYKEFLRNLSKVSINKYRVASHDARFVIKKRKSANFKKFIDELIPSSNPKNFWNVIKIFRNSEFFASKNILNIGKADLVNDFVLQFALSGLIHSFPDNIVTKYPSFFDMEFHLSELEDLISSARENSSPGCDLINYSILKMLLLFKGYWSSLIEFFTIPLSLLYGGNTILL